MVPWRGFVTLKNLAVVWEIISLLLSISSYWHATVAQEWCWIDKKLHFFSSSLKLAMCCFLKRLLEWCVPGLISLLSDELVLCCYSLTLYLSAYFLCSVCRKMILLSTQQFRIVDIQSFVTFLFRYALIIARDWWYYFPICASFKVICNSFEGLFLF